MIDGCYIGESVNGPWKQSKFEFDSRDRRIIEGLSNLTFAKREDGTYIMICRGGGVWFSETGLSPYNQVTEKRVYPPVDGRFEDPVIWKTNVQYHLIVNDWLGRIAWYLRSKDGINWKVDPGEAYMPGIARYKDGTKVDWFKYERIKMLQDDLGRATQAHFAVIDTIKWNDLKNDSHSSKHIVIPLTVGRQISIINEEIIDENSHAIHVLIKAEKGFNPHEDIDLESLRFGASEEVNYGRGCKVKSTEKNGHDLIVIFNGKGNGLTNDNFAAKLLGRTKEGKLIFGWSRLYGVEYNEPALSARLPKILMKGKEGIAEVEVQNFGQVSSKPSPIRIESDSNSRVLARGTIQALKPFEKTTLKLKVKDLDSVPSRLKVVTIITPDDQKPVLLHGEVNVSKIN